MWIKKQHEHLTALWWSCSDTFVAQQDIKCVFLYTDKTQITASYFFLVVPPFWSSAVSKSADSRLGISDLYLVNKKKNILLLKSKILPQWLLFHLPMVTQSVQQQHHSSSTPSLGGWDHLLQMTNVEVPLQNFWLRSFQPLQITTYSKTSRVGKVMLSVSKNISAAGGAKEGKLKATLLPSLSCCACTSSCLSALCHWMKIDRLDNFVGSLKEASWQKQQSAAG